jgi:hypothetical protein
MPIPKPSSQETEKEYVSRCMSDISGEYGEEQAAAICYNTYRTEMNKMPTAQRVFGKMLRVSKFKGINLTKLENGLEDACWDGYIAIGTKILDGKEVPNCVPEE